MALEETAKTPLMIHHIARIEPPDDRDISGATAKSVTEEFARDIAGALNWTPVV